MNIYQTQSEFETAFEAMNLDSKNKNMFSNDNDQDMDSDTDEENDFDDVKTAASSQKSISMLTEVIPITPDDFIAN